MKEIRVIIVALLFSIVGFSSCVLGQSGPCYHFTDTLLFKGNLLSVRVKGCFGECTTVECLVADETQKEKAIRTIGDAFFNRSVYWNEDTVLLLSSPLSARQFAVMKSYLEDSLSSRFTKGEIVESLIWGVHYEDTTDYRVAEPAPIPIEEISIANLYFEGNGFRKSEFFDFSLPPESNDTIMVQGGSLFVKSYPYESWGVIAELNDCDFFPYEVGERLFHDAKCSSIRIFIPLSMR